jgi:hypothetical protein
MIMIGVSCEKCGSDLLDCGNKCVHCGHPYSDFVLKMAESHKKAAMVMVDKMKSDGDFSEERMLGDIEKLAKISTGLAEAKKASDSLGLSS